MIVIMHTASVCGHYWVLSTKEWSAVWLWCVSSTDILLLFKYRLIRYCINLACTIHWSLHITLDTPKRKWKTISGQKSRFFYSPAWVKWLFTFILYGPLGLNSMTFMLEPFWTMYICWVILKAFLYSFCAKQHKITHLGNPVKVAQRRSYLVVPHYTNFVKTHVIGSDDRHISWLWIATENSPFLF